MFIDRLEVNDKGIFSMFVHLDNFNYIVLFSQKHFLTIFIYRFTITHSSGKLRVITAHCNNECSYHTLQFDVRLIRFIQRLLAKRDVIISCNLLSKTM